MNHRPKRPPAATMPRDHIERDGIVELPYLDVGRRVFVVTDERGWLIGQGMALSDAEAMRVLARLQSVLDEYRKRPRPTLLP